MELLYDMHTHTIASGHAYNTILENIEYAYSLGLKAYGFSDHGPALDGAPNELYFRHFRVLDRFYKDMKVYAGIEANIIDYSGSIDISGKTLGRVDYIIASMHTLCIEPGSIDDNMRAYIGAMKNRYIKIIGHPDDSRFKVDYSELAKNAVKYGVALEVNSSSLDPDSVRSGARENIINMLMECKKAGAYVICGSDAHVRTDIARFDEVKKILIETDFPEELVLNTSMEKIKYILNENKYNL